MKTSRRSALLAATTLVALLVTLGSASASVHVLATGFSHVTSLEVDAVGNVYVADGENGVSKWSPTGSLVTVYSGRARGVAVDELGNVYMTEYVGANTLTTRKVSPNGTPQWSAGVSQGGWAVAAGAGRVFVSDRDRVVAYDAATGQLVGSSPSVAQTGDANWVADVEYAFGQVYVLTNGRVHMLGGNLQPIATFPVGSSDASAELDIDAQSVVRVAWSGRSLDVFDATFQRIATEDEARSPWAVAAFENRVYVSRGLQEVVWLEPGSGPVPPSEGPSVTINEGDTYTNDPDVTVRAIPPGGTGSVFVANDGGFQGASMYAPFAQIAWRLPVTAAERLPKTVYVRFTPSGLTLQDDIILDQTRPVVARASVERIRGRLHRVRVKARDRTSGLRAVQIRHKGRTIARMPRFKAASRLRLPRTGKLRVRVRDGAGNWSRSKAIRRR